MVDIANSIARRALMVSAVAAAAVSPLSANAATQPTTAEKRLPMIQKPVYRTKKVGNVEVYYREAGRPEAPVILLLHGFPTSGHMFRDLIPELADQYRVIAPDLPGFGETKAPARGQYDYTFDNLAKVIEGFVDALQLKRYAIYIFDYGAPTGLRLAMAQPDRISAIISQNGNAYVEGLSDGWNPIQRYWKEPSDANRNALRAFLKPDAVRSQYVAGVPDPSLVSRDGSNLDSFFMNRPEAEEIQLDLLYDYRNNVSLYPAFQDYFRKRQPPLLAAWGKNDPFFLPAGAEAYKRDLPKAEVHFFDAGHFAIETHHWEIAALIRKFLPQHV
jgi:pimeloyl-ACP methyl ester carboxylesterase